MSGAQFFAVPEAVQTFAHLRLLARPGGQVSVPDAYGDFLEFCRLRGTVPVSATLFAATLHQLAARVGGRRDGDAVIGLIWRDDALALMDPATGSAGAAGKTR